MLVNGILNGPISAADRGFLYGDGVFRTFRIKNGKPRLWPRHFQKLQADCSALGLTCPSEELLLQELHRVIEGQADGVAKIVITRGEGVRGYAPGNPPKPTRVISISPVPHYPEHFYSLGINLCVCNLRLSRQPKLAGIKHLNRLENVLAAAALGEYDDEGLLLDSLGNVVECTRSNLFLIKNGEIATPDLTHCGIAGVERERVIEWAAANNLPCRIGTFGLAECFAADEIFVVNSVIGLWPVKILQDRSWERHPVSRQVQEWLETSE